MSTTYRVIVTGKALIDDQEMIRNNLKQTFDLPEQQLTALLSQKPLVIKKNLEASLAMKYKKAIEQAGLETKVEAMEDETLYDAAQSLEHSAASESEPEPQESHQQNTEAQASQPSATKDTQIKDTQIKETQTKQAPATDFRLAPVGARIGPRAAVKAFQTDAIDELTADYSERLAPETEKGPEPPATDHLSADFAERLSPETEAGPEPPATDHIQLGELGENMAEAKAEQTLELDLSALSLKEKKES